MFRNADLHCNAILESFLKQSNPKDQICEQALHHPRNRQGFDSLRLKFTASPRNERTTETSPALPTQVPEFQENTTDTNFRNAKKILPADTANTASLNNELQFTVWRAPLENGFEPQRVKYLMLEIKFNSLNRENYNIESTVVPGVPKSP